MPGELEEGFSWRQGQDLGLGFLDAESSLQKTIASMQAAVSPIAGFYSFAKGHLGFFRSSFINKYIH